MSHDYLFGNAILRELLIITFFAVSQILRSPDKQNLKKYNGNL